MNSGGGEFTRASCKRRLLFSSSACDLTPFGWSQADVHTFLSEDARDHMFSPGHRAAPPPNAELGLSPEKRRRMSYPGSDDGGFQTFKEALGTLDFHRRYVLSCLLTKDRVLSLEMLNKLKGVPIQGFEEHVRSLLGVTVQNKKSSSNVHDLYSSQKSGGEKSWIYSCSIDAFGNCTFQTPVREPGVTPLQRAFGEDKILHVNFVKNNSKDIKDLKLKFGSVLREGITVGQRHFEYLVHKEEKKRKSEKSALEKKTSRCCFLCTRSSARYDLSDTYFSQQHQSLEQRLSYLMHAHTVSTTHLYNKRLQLALSKTSKAPIDMSTVNVQQIRDIPCKNDRGEIVRDSSGKPLIHTDGTGYISVDLARKCAQIAVGSVAYPALLQVRLFYRGMVIKGTLLALQTLPPETIEFRDSMLKVKTDRKYAEWPTYDSLEICGWSFKPQTAYLSRYIVALLIIGRVPERLIMQAVQDAITRAETGVSSVKGAAQLCRRFSEIGDMAFRMLAARVPLEDPFIQQSLRNILKSQLRSFAKCKVQLEESYYLMGTADPTGTLRRNEVAIILENGPIYRHRLLVYKHPGMHYGDIHVFEATCTEALLQHIGDAKYVIIFPTQGTRSVVDEIANSDLDGDMYWICTNTEIVENFIPRAPWQHPQAGTAGTESPSPSGLSSERFKECQIALFLNATLSPNMAVPRAATNWLIHIDRYLALHEGETGEMSYRDSCILQLVDLYYKALDSEKTGEKVDIPEHLIENSKPHFMDSHNYKSKSIFGKIYDYVMEESKREEQQSIRLPVWYQQFEYGEYRNYKLLWKRHYESFKKERQTAWCDESTRAGRMTGVVNKYRELLFTGSTVWEEAMKSPEQIKEEACAIYSAVYENGMEKGSSDFSFAWKVAGEVLCALHCHGIDLNGRSRYIFHPEFMSIWYSE